MSCAVRIQTGATEPIEVLALDAALDPVTGKTDLLLSIRRKSDDFFYDFDDDTFKTSGWTDRQVALTEVDATNAPGEYAYDWDTSAITNETADDTYEIRVDQDPGTDVKNLPQVGEIKLGQFVDNIDAAISSRSSHSAADVWAVATRELTSIATVMDTQGYSAARAALLDRLDVLLSSRSSHTAADVWAVGTRTLTDISAVLDAHGYTAARAALLDNIDAAISSRSSHAAADVWAVATRTLTSIAAVMDAQGYTAARAALMDNMDVLLSSRSSHSAADVWNVGTRELTSISAVMDAQGYSAARAALLDNLDATISSVLAAVGSLNDPSAAEVAAAVDFALSMAHGAGAWLTGVAPTVGEIDAELTAQHGVGSWTTGAGGDPALIASAVWNKPTSELTTAGSIGELLYSRIKSALLTFTQFLGLK